MEEWVGRQWHRFITRAADGRASHAPVRLEEMQRTIGLMFRAGGGGQGVRIAPAGTSRVGGARSLLQRIAGGGTHAVLGQWQADVLALPPEIGVFDEARHNRDLYLWLAALAAHLDPAQGWLAGHVAAAEAALAAFPGLRPRYARLRASSWRSAPTRHACAAARPRPSTPCSRPCTATPHPAWTCAMATWRHCGCGSPSPAPTPPAPRPRKKNRARAPRKVPSSPPP